MLDLTDWQNKKYTTRDGRPVRVLCVDAKRGGSIIGLISNGSGAEELHSWFDEGYTSALRCTDDTNLININAKTKTKREGWVNIYPKDSCIITQGIYDSEDKVAAILRGEAIARVHIEWEE